MRIRIIAEVAGIGVLMAVPARAGVIEFTDKDEWIAAVGPFTTIDFTDYPAGTVITDQYADLGVLFTDGNDNIFCCDETYLLNDGAGLSGNFPPLSPDFHLSFPIPQRWLAVDFPGAIQITTSIGGKCFHVPLGPGCGG